MNRHLKIAFFVAPILALGTYALTGYLLPKPTTPSNQGQLRLLGQCQPRENACIFQSGDLEVKLISNEKQQQQQLAAYTNKPITDFSVALGNQSGFVQFPMMKSDNAKYWQIKLNNNDNILIYNKLRMAFKYQAKAYYVDSEVLF